VFRLETRVWWRQSVPLNQALKAVRYERAQANDATGNGSGAVFNATGPLFT